MRLIKGISAIVAMVVMTLSCGEDNQKSDAQELEALSIEIINSNETKNFISAQTHFLETVSDFVTKGGDLDQLKNVTLKSYAPICSLIPILH